MKTHFLVEFEERPGRPLRMKVERLSPMSPVSEKVARELRKKLGNNNTKPKNKGLK